MAADGYAEIEKLMPGSCALAVDLGCGDMLHGSFERLYEGRGYGRVIGVDAHEPAIWERRKHYQGRQGFSFEVADMAEYPLPACGLVTAIHSLEHLHIWAVMPLIAEFQRRAAMVIVETPDQFEDGEAEATRSGNEYQRHLCLLDAVLMESQGFERMHTYQRNAMYSNSIYLWVA